MITHSRLVKKSVILFLSLMMLTVLTSAKKNCSACKPRLLPLTSVHIVDRNGFSETISNKDRLSQFQKVDFLASQPYQKVLRVFARDSKGNIRSIVTSYHENGNPRQSLEIVNGRAYGHYKEWHENGKIFITSKVIGGVADITQTAQRSWLFDNTSQVWDEDGNLTAVIPYSQGSLEGDSLYYHINGKVWKKIPYVKNQINGTVEIFKDSGELLQQMSYQNGLKHGSSTRFWAPNQMASQEDYHSGKIHNAQYFDKKGKLISQIEQGTGYRATFGKESISELQEYRNGDLAGEVKVYTPIGSLKRSYHIKNGIKHGEEVEYFDQLPFLTQATETAPSPKISFHWHEGKIHGLVKTWYSNGNQESQKEMSNNRKTGLSTVWYKDGNLMMIEEYDQDKLVKGDYFRKGDRIPASQVIQGKGIVTLFDAEGHFLKKIPYLNGKPSDS